MKNILPIIVIVLLATAFGAFFIISKDKASQPLITNFEECAEAGYPILEIYPEQCRTPDNQLFTKYINLTKTEFGSPVTLHINEQTIFGDGLTTTLLEINDSRCKNDTVCIWAGELAFQFKIMGGNVNQDTKIKLGTISTKSITSNGYIFTLREATENTSTITVTKIKGDEPVACTAEAKLCPDGSAVGRTGPNCEFAPCRNSTNQIGRECAGPNDTNCPTNFECKPGCGSPVGYEGEPPPTYYCQLKGYIRNCPICLAKNTLIDTLQGTVPIQDLKIGTPIWTVNKSGERVIGFVNLVSKTAVPLDHQMVNLILKDGRTLLVSPGHPTIDGRTVGDLAVGDLYDNSQVLSAERVSYTKEYTYDILPDGETGFYFANGILLDSSLR